MLCDLPKVTKLLSKEGVFILTLIIIRNQYLFPYHLASFYAALLTIGENSRTLAGGNGQLRITIASVLT